MANVAGAYLYLACVERIRPGIASRIYTGQIHPCLDAMLWVCEHRRDGHLHPPLRLVTSNVPRSPCYEETAMYMPTRHEMGKIRTSEYVIEITSYFSF